ncbi:hypothetical protein ACOSQ2_010103 [Xanthoceras sorbifolium]
MKEKKTCHSRSFRAGLLLCDHFSSLCGHYLSEFREEYMIKPKLGWYEEEQHSNSRSKEKVFSESTLASNDIPNLGVGSTTSDVGDWPFPIMVEAYHLEKKHLRRLVTRSARKSNLLPAVESSGMNMPKVDVFLSSSNNDKEWHLKWLLASGDWMSEIQMHGRQCCVFSVVDNQAVLVWNERAELPSGTRGNILSPTRMRKTDLGDSSTLSKKAIRWATPGLKRKFGELNGNEDWMEETMRAMAFHSELVKPWSSPCCCSFRD